MPEQSELAAQRMRPQGPNATVGRSEVSSYDQNPLIEACGPILSFAQIARQLLHLPPVPKHRDNSLQGHVLEHALGDIWRLHVPTPAGIQIAQSLDFMIRQGYVHRRPRTAATNRLLHGLPAIGGDQAAIQLAAAVGGIAGVGKSEALGRALNLKPQVVTHAEFPGMKGPVSQLIWLKLDVPESGRIADLAESLFRATDDALGSNYREHLAGGRTRGGINLAGDWLAKVRCNFLGVLVLDEVQNLFKIATKARRTAANRGGRDRPELGIVDDQALKFILTLTNTSKIPVVVAGTPDGMSVLVTRMSTAQRISTEGYHEIPYAASADDAYFKKYFFPHLAAYQYLPEQLHPGDELRCAVHRLSGGVSRIAIAVWIHGQRHAISRGSPRLELEDLQAAADGPLRLMQPAVAALLSQDPQRMVLYQDLLPYGGS